LRSQVRSRNPRGVSEAYCKTAGRLDQDGQIAYLCICGQRVSLVTTPGGPVFRQVELAKVRSNLADYLHTMEELGTLGTIETLHVRGVNKNTLGLMRPIYYLKKRLPGEVEFWAPVFKSEDSRTIYTYAASAKRETPVDCGHEILALHALVAEALRKDGRLDSPYDLRPDRVFPDETKDLLATLMLQPYQLKFSTAVNEDMPAIPIFRNGKSYLAAEHRRAQDRYSIYIGGDPQDLPERLSSDLDRRGKINSSKHIELMEID